MPKVKFDKNGKTSILKDAAIPYEFRDSLYALPSNLI